MEQSIKSQAQGGLNLLRMADYAARTLGISGKVDCFRMKSVKTWMSCDRSCNSHDYSSKISFKSLYNKKILVFIYVRGTIPASQDMNTSAS